MELGGEGKSQGNGELTKTEGQKPALYTFSGFLFPITFFPFLHFFPFSLFPLFNYVFSLVPKKSKSFIFTGRTLHSNTVGLSTNETTQMILRVSSACAAPWISVLARTTWYNLRGIVWSMFGYSRDIDVDIYSGKNTETRDKRHMSTESNVKFCNVDELPHWE